MLCFELTMPNRGSWNGRWSGENDYYAILKTERRVGKAKVRELDGEHFHYRWDDGWTAMVSCRKVDATEARKLRRRSKGFCGYDWMVESILRHGEIRRGP